MHKIATQEITIVYLYNERMGKKNGYKKLLPDLNSTICQGDNKVLLRKMEGTNLPGMVQFLHDLPLSRGPEVNDPFVDFAVLSRDS